MFHWYGLVVGIAVVVWWGVVERIEPKVKKMIPWILLAALVGARVWHVVDQWEYYAQDWWRAAEVWNGGLSIWGAILVGGSLGMVTRTLPILVTPLPLAQAIGRLGNGVSGEFTQRVWILPWWGAEAILDLMLFVLLRGVSSKYRIWVYLVGYGLIRLVLQPYRL